MKEQLTFDSYQSDARKTAIYPKEAAIIFPTLGLVGEAGEVAEKVKKTIRDNGGVFDDDRRKAIMKELGDVLWYIASVSYDLGYTMQEVAEANIEKISARASNNTIHGNGDER